ncbi:MAG: FKBP-type peptidyl-prolyl cis-trans isomerase [Bacteroidetes bacterium]|nr:FKBP-type peptidyl-prolyl cis-trans isomerase [Bacteroidota bacterium]
MTTIKLTNVLVLAAVLAVGCKKMSYKKTKSGLVYKIFSGKGSDSLKVNDIVKFNYAIRYNDSLMEAYNSYGKIPGYLRVSYQEGKPSYDLNEVLPMLKVGDSLITVQMSDTLMKTQAANLPPNAKKGDRITTTIKIVQRFTSDSLARIDYEKEAEKDKPRQLKEQQEMMAKAKKEIEERQKKEDEELARSGEMAKQVSNMEKYLAERKIQAVKTGKGTFVEIKQQGSGAAAAPGKYVLVKYTGRILATDSIFQSNSFPVQLGSGSVIRGWDEGLLLFKEGGKGVLYIPGFLAYGDHPPAGSPFKLQEALKFEVELLKVSDTPIK